MPIIINNKQLDVKTLAADLDKKKQELRPKYALNRQLSEKEYNESKIIIDGKEKSLSASSKYLLDMISEE